MNTSDSARPAESAAGVKDSAGAVSGAWPEDGELIVGLVGPVGVNLRAVGDAVVEALASVDYRTETIRLTDVLTGLGGEFGGAAAAPEDERLEQLMDRGNALRLRVGSAAAMAMLGVWGIGVAREALQSANAKRRAYILRQLKRPEEVAALRRLYGENFVVVAVYTQEAERVDALSAAIARSHNDMDARAYRDAAYRLVQRDEREEASSGQQLRDTFWRADLFVDPSKPREMTDAVQRFVDLLFARRVSTPTKDEFAMFSAWASAMRSGSLARQVGAVLYDDEGSFIAGGTNDVPRFGGGLYWENDADDARDHKIGHDASDVRREQMVAEMLGELANAGWLAANIEELDPQELADRALRGDKAPLKASRVTAVIEYVRAAHAEQAALMDAARRGAATQGASMAVTTFPCHECARLIVAAGVMRVCYVEPYPKSLAASMYQDSISVGTPRSDRVLFEPFLGVAPRIYMRLFSAEDLIRKLPDGSVYVPDPDASQLRLTYGGSRLLLDEAEDAFTAPLTLLNTPEPST